MKKLLIISLALFSICAQAQTKDSSVNYAGIELQKAANCRFNSIVSSMIGATVLGLSQTKEGIIFTVFAMGAAGVFQFCAIVHEKNAGKHLSGVK